MHDRLVSRRTDALKEPTIDFKRNSNNSAKDSTHYIAINISRSTVSIENTNGAI